MWNLIIVRKQEHSRAQFANELSISKCDRFSTSLRNDLNIEMPPWLTVYFWTAYIVVFYNGKITKTPENWPISRTEARPRIRHSW